MDADTRKLLLLFSKAATPRPWSFTDALHFGLAFSVIDARGNCIAACRELAKDTDKHNAALIVAAVNSFEGLLNENDRLQERVKALEAEKKHDDDE